MLELQQHNIFWSAQLHSCCVHDTCQKVIYRVLSKVADSKKKYSKLESWKFFRELLISEQKRLVWIRVVISASAVVLLWAIGRTFVVSHHVHLLPLSVCIGYRQYPWTDLLSITIRLKGRRLVNEAWIIVDGFHHKNNLLAMISSQRLQAEI